MLHELTEMRSVSETEHSLVCTVILHTLCYTVVKIATLYFLPYKLRQKLRTRNQHKAISANVEISTIHVRAFFQVSSTKGRTKIKTPSTSVMRSIIIRFLATDHTDQHDNVLVKIQHSTLSFCYVISFKNPWETVSLMTR